MAILKSTGARALLLPVLALVALLGLASSATADEHVKGTITMRGDNQFTIQTEDGAAILVVLADITEIKLHDDGSKGFAKDLIPGLRVDLEGSYETTNRLIATQIKYSRADLKLAHAIKAGLTPTDQQVQQNSMDIQQHGVTLDQHGQTIQQHGRDLVDHDQRIVGTTGAIANTNTRVSNLDDFNVVETFTVLFPNGRANVPAKYHDQIAELAGRAKQLHGYVVQVQGYASAVGSRSVNEALSMRRADAVTALLAQRGGIPPTNIVMPAAMGISEQVAENKTRAGQAQNRRVVVTILQNKGIAEK